MKFVSRFVLFALCGVGDMIIVPAAAGVLIDKEKHAADQNKNGHSIRAPPALRKLGMSSSTSKSSLSKSKSGSVNDQSCGIPFPKEPKEKVCPTDKIKCGDTLSGYVQLMSDLTCHWETASFGLVLAQDAVLDCQGHEINCIDPPCAIGVEMQDMSAVKNCKVSNFEVGIQMGGKDNIVKDSSVMGSTTNGIEATSNSKGCLTLDAVSSTFNEGSGFRHENSQALTIYITDSHFDNNLSHGIEGSSAKGNNQKMVVHDSTADKNADAGLSVKGRGQSVDLYGRISASFNRDDGMYIIDTKDVRFVDGDFVMVRNRANGISVGQGGNIVFAKGTSTKLEFNTDSGLSLRSFVRLAKATVEDTALVEANFNGEHGFSVSGTKTSLEIENGGTVAAVENFEFGFFIFQNGKVLLKDDGSSMIACQNGSDDVKRFGGSLSCEIEGPCSLGSCAKVQRKNIFDGAECKD